MYPKIIPNYVIIQSNPKIPNNHRHHLCRHRHIAEEWVPKLSRVSVITSSPEIRAHCLNIAIKLAKCHLAGEIIHKAFEATAVTISSQIWETCEFCKSQSHETSNHRWEIVTFVFLLRLEIYLQSHLAVDARSKVHH